MEEVAPFRIDIPRADLDDLRDRLTRTRWPDQLPGTGWDYGIPLEYGWPTIPGRPGRCRMGHQTFGGYG